MAYELALKVSSALLFSSSSGAAFSDRKLPIEPINVRQESVSGGNSVPLSNSSEQQPAAESVIDLSAIKSKLNEVTQSLNSELSFSIDDSSGEVVVKVIDARTDEVIRQIPTEAVLAVLQNIIENKGGLLKEQA